MGRVVGGEKRSGEVLERELVRRARRVKVRG